MNETTAYKWARQALRVFEDKYLGAHLYQQAGDSVASAVLEAFREGQNSDSLVRSLKASNEGRQELIDDLMSELLEKERKIIRLDEQVKRYQVYNHEKHLITLKLKGLLEKERRLIKADKK